MGPANSRKSWMADVRLAVVPNPEALMRAVATFLLAISLTLLLGEPASASKRVALVVGNSSYQRVARLANPVNDSEAMAAMLTNADFDVVSLKRDLTTNEMRRALR